MSKNKTIDFSRLGAVIDQRLKTSTPSRPMDRPMMLAAVFNARFRESELLAWLQKQQYEISSTDKAWLSEHTTAVAGQHHSAVRVSTRAHLLGQLYSENNGELADLQQRFQFTSPTLADELLETLLRKQLMDQQVNSMNQEELQTLLEVLRWLQETDLAIVWHWKVEAKWAREKLTTHFRAHTTHFKGRDDELEQVNDFIFSPIEKNSNLQQGMLIHGIGGSGKSTLISKFILDELLDEKENLPFVFLDFDQAGLSIAEPLQLAIEALRQLMIQFPVEPGKTDVLRDVREDLISFVERSSAEDLASFNENFDQIAPPSHLFRSPGKSNMSQAAQKYSTRGETREFFVENIIRRYADSVNTSVPITIVFDSFEEAQFRATTSELMNLFDFVIEISNTLPNLRLLIVGRSDLIVGPLELEPLEIKDFGEDSAQAYLQALGVKKSTTRKFIYETIGGNPLNLKLAANLAQKNLKNLNEFKEELEEHQIKEQLIRRNIEHIPDERVQQLALPGMLVRSISPRLISKVLAPCSKLGPVSEDEARELFNLLSRLTFLTANRAGIVAFRRDLRMALRSLVEREDEEAVKRLHQKAMQFYAQDQSALGQAEYLYHRLQIEAPSFLENWEADWAALRPFLENALPELSADANSALSRHLGLRITHDTEEELSNIEQERHLAEEIAQRLVSGDTEKRLRKLWVNNQHLTGTDNNYLYQRALLGIRLGESPQETSASLLDAATFGWGSLYLWFLLANYNAGDEDELFARGLTLSEHNWDEASYPEFLDFTQITVLIGKLRGKFHQSFDWARLLNEIMQLLHTYYPHSSAHKQEMPRIYEALSNRKGTWIAIEELIRYTNQKDKPGFASYRRILDMVYDTYRQQYQSGYLEYLDQQFISYGAEDINERLFKSYQALISDLTIPGSWPILVQDLIDHLLARHQGDLTQNRIISIEVNERGYTPDPIDKDLEDKDVSHISEEIAILIAQDKHNKALELLRELGEDMVDQNTIILFQARLSRLERNEQMGVIRSDEANIERNRLGHAILGVAKDL